MVEGPLFVSDKPKPSGCLSCLLHGLLALQEARMRLVADGEPGHRRV